MPGKTNLEVMYACGSAGKLKPEKLCKISKLTNAWYVLVSQDSAIRLT